MTTKVVPEEIEEAYEHESKRKQIQPQLRFEGNQRTRRARPGRRTGGGPTGDDAETPLDAETIAKRFHGARKKRMAQVLERLADRLLLIQDDDGHYISLR